MRKPLVQDFLRMTLASAVIAAVFLVYLFVVGAPSTNARNFYNQAMLTNNFPERRRLLQESEQIWHTDEAARELAKVNELLGQK